MVAHRGCLPKGIAVPDGEFDRSLAADPVHDPACQGPFPFHRFEKFEHQRRAPAVDGKDPHRLNPKQSVTICRRSPGGNTLG